MQLKLHTQKKKKHITIGFSMLLFLLLPLCIYSQTATNSTLADNISSKLTDGANPNIPDILLEWDYSQITNTENLSFYIEVQPMGTCWEGVNGKLRSEKKTYQIENTVIGLKNELRLTLSALDCKCLKWRVKAINNQTESETYTDWVFASFM